MRSSSKIGRYVVLLMGLIMILGGWMALVAAQERLKKAATERASRRKPGEPSTLGAPRATGPMAGTGPSAASGPSGASGPRRTTGPSGASGAIPPGAIW